jgi:MYXO-CTERM domain-containing protein
MRRLLLLLTVAVLALPSVAAAGPILDRTVQALSSNPVYVDPQAETTISQAEGEELRGRIEASDAVPLYIAIVPRAARNEAGGDATEFLRLLAKQLDRRGTYAVVVGGQFRAGSSVLPKGAAARTATEAFEQHGDEGLAPTLLAFVDGVAAERRGGVEGGSDDSSGSNVFPILVAAGAAVGGFLLLRRRRRARQAREALATGKAVAQEDMLALADDIRALDLDVEMPGVDPDAKEHYGRAVEAYERADRAYDTARRPGDLAAVSSALEEGRYEMASAKARLEGRDVPERLPPCFFDPRHGPSVRNILWAPPGGEPREVPACAADAVRLESGEEPEQREVLVGGRQTPFWGVPGLRPYASGFYGTFDSGLVPGFLLGSVFGGAMFGGSDAHAATASDDDSGDFGGDFSGGDFGGGDFGGGGGGDFGGGGGDF